MRANYNSVTIGGGYSPHHRERRQGAGLSFLPPNRLPKGGLRRSEQSDRLSDFIREVTS